MIQTQIQMELQKTCRWLADHYPKKKPLLKSLMKLPAALWEHPPAEIYTDENHHYQFLYSTETIEYGRTEVLIVIGMSIRPLIVVTRGNTVQKYSCYDKSKVIQHTQDIISFIKN